jgi:hypothetical protein
VKRTSTSHPLRVDWLLQYPGARLGLTFVPGRTDDLWERNLDVDLDALAAAGVKVVVSPLSVDELTQVGAGGLVVGVRDRVMDYVGPAGQKRSALTWTLDDLVDEALGRLAAGADVVVVCQAGLHEGALVAAACLVATGATPAVALAAVRECRGATALQSPEFSDRLAGFAAARASLLDAANAKGDQRRLAALDARLRAMHGLIPDAMINALKTLIDLARPRFGPHGPRIGLCAGIPTYGREVTAADQVIEALDNARALVVTDADDDAPSRFLIASFTIIREALDLFRETLSGPAPGGLEHDSARFELLAAALDSDDTTKDEGAIRVYLGPQPTGADWRPRANLCRGCVNGLRQGVTAQVGWSADELLDAIEMKLHAIQSMGSAMLDAGLALGAAHSPDYLWGSIMGVPATVQDFGHALRTTSWWSLARLKAARRVAAAQALVP